MDCPRQEQRQAAERRELELRLAAENVERRAAETEARVAREAAQAVRLAAEADQSAKAEAAKREADKDHMRKINTAAVIPTDNPIILMKVVVLFFHKLRHEVLK